MAGTARPEPVRYRPRRIRVVAWVAAGAVLAAAVVLALALEGRIGSGPEVFGPADRVALIGLGGLGAGVLLWLTRPLVVADAEGIRVRNLIGGCRVPWQVVRGIRFEPGASWATLLLADDEAVGIVAIQAVDHDRAVAAARALRALHAAHHQRASS